jgi:hypothetical protein
MAALDICAQIRYIQWQQLYTQEKPFQVHADIPEDARDKRKTNVVFEEKDTIIHDVRGNEDQFSLDKTGFMYCKHQTAVTDFEVHQDVEENYLPEVEKLLREKVEGVDQVFLFNWKVANLFPM